MTASAEVRFDLVPCVTLSDAQQREMFELLAQHFMGVTTDQFTRDLSEKHLALLLRRQDTLVGFSSLLAYTTWFEGETVNVIYSGDTIVSPDAWGTTALPRAWVAGVEALRQTLPEGRCFWLLLTSGFRTYRFLPVFWREFYPRFDVPTPPAAQRMLNHLASQRFGKHFDPRSGIVRFPHPQKLRAGLNELPLGRERNPHVACFLSRNPGCVNGEELVCLTELCQSNLTAAGRRMMNPRPRATQSHHR